MGEKFPGVRVDPAQWSIKEWKQVATVWTNASRLLCPTPCFLLSMNVAGYRNDNGELMLYDAHGAIGSEKYHIRVMSTDSKFIDFTVPVYFSKAMYVNLVNKIDCVTIQYLPWNP
ncbi:unnamed protein product [marine sediment metagenome]|uniref:Uncharacterized protein n=1 Tax=marine sediment metagenome TaxID=412755 RepID=X1IX74_9ZZZZ